MTGKIHEEGCVFCNRVQGDDQEQLVLHRGCHWYVIMNLYPYNNGHLLLVLNRHAPALTACEPDELEEMGRLLWIMESVLRRAMDPHGINCGYNGGSSAGAGIPEHLHVHMLPRWGGDTNFMTTVGRTRVMPQTLRETYEQLLPHFAGMAQEPDAPGGDRDHRR
ncbi:MAG: HIT domain-containing protein [Candidatus Krumholzibacteriia bacterium]